MPPGMLDLSIRRLQQRMKLNLVTGSIPIGDI